MGLQVNPSAPKSSSIIKEDFGDPVVAVRLGKAGLGIATADYETRATESKLADAAEQVRLAYVGATRAREHLVVSVHRSATDKSSLAAKIAELDELHNATTGFELPKAKSQKPGSDKASAKQAEKYSLNDRSNWHDDLVVLKHNAEYRGYVTPSELADHSMFEAPKPEDNTESTEWNSARRGRGGTDVGSAVHGILQDIDFDDHSNLGELAHQAANEYAIPDLETDIAQLVRNVLESPTVALATNDNSWSEAWVAAEIEDGLEVEGSVDLMIQHEDDSITIVDYKTDRVQGELLEERARGYENQLAGYVLVLEKMGMKVRDAVLVFADGGKDGLATEYFVKDLSTAKAAAVEKITTQIRA
jgi:ATP-dependent exoDNAse (exonuclease V) beta subunit